MLYIFSLFFQYIFVTNNNKFKNDKFLQSLKRFFMLVTLDVSNLDKFNDNKDLHSLKEDSIFIIEDVSKFDKFISFKL